MHMTGPCSNATRGSREPHLEHGRSQPQPSWPPGLGLSGQANTGRGLQFLHAQSRAPLQSNPQRASQRLCRRPAHPALRVFYTPMQPCMNVTSTFPEPAPAPSQAMDTHSQGCPGSSVNSESSKVGAHDTTHPAGGELVQDDIFIPPNV